eukprot:PITA_29651
MLLLHLTKTSIRALATHATTDSISPQHIKLLCMRGLKETLQILKVTDYPFNANTYIHLLQACVKKRTLSHGKLVHAHILETGFLPNRCLWNTLVNIYAKCGSLVDARRVFDRMPERDTFSWTVMISAYAAHGPADESLAFFHQMQLAGIQPNQFTFASVLPACAKLEDLDEGRKIHEEIISCGFQSDVFVGSALVDMYAKCGRIEDARDVFDKMHQRDVVSWNAMIGRYVQNGHDDEAVKLFKRMQMAGVKPDLNTFASVLPACVGPADLELGMEIHEEIVRSGLRMDIFVQSALVDMYAKCGRIEKAQELFHKMPQRNVVSWTTMIVGCAQNGLGFKGLKLFQEMQASGAKPDLKTFVSVLTACASLAALEQGMEIHAKIMRSGFDFDVFVGTALIDMYAKCGRIDNARTLFDKMPQRNFVSWTAIIAGYAMHGFAQETMQLFEQMQYIGLNPDHVTFVCVLSACCHAGLVDQGCQYFDSMSKCYQITPTMEHYGCMVDLFGRAGCLEEAMDFINKMPIKPDATVWSCLLGACRIHNNVELGELAAGHLFELEPTKSSHYVLLSNIYAAAGRWDGIEKLRTMMKDGRIVKTPGCSWIVINKQAHEEQIICQHKKKPEITFGLINTLPWNSYLNDKEPHSVW